MTDVETEPKSIDEVFREERRALTRLAFLLTGDRDSAEDVMQTAFAAVHSRWDNIDDPPAYLRRVVVNQAKDFHRRRYRQPPIPVEAVTQIPEIDETWAELRRLPDRQREVVVLRFYEDMPLTEIAQLLDRPPGTIRSELHRALNRLRRTLP